MIVYVSYRQFTKLNHSIFLTSDRRVSTILNTTLLHIVKEISGQFPVLFVGTSTLFVQIKLDTFSHVCGAQIE